MAEAKSPFSVAGNVSEDARKTMNSAIDAFSNWRDEFAQHSEKNSKAVFDQMAAAAKSFGWPTEFVDMTRNQMQSASKMQLQFMDQVMDIWTNQMKNPTAAFKPEAWQDAYKKLTANIPGMPGSGTSFPGMPTLPGMPNFPGMQNMPGMTGNPFQFWMQAAEMWQKSWEQGMKAWMDQANKMTGSK
jgi:hypothetical protein